MKRYRVVVAALLFLAAAAARPTARSAESRESLPRLEVSGHFFRQETSARWTGIQATDFNLFNRFLGGEDITPILRQRADAGFNLLRVWTDFDVCADAKCPEHQPIGRLIPREHPDYYKRLPDFLDVCAGHGFYVELTAFTGRPDSDAARIAHWDQLIAVASAHTNVLLELINEHNVHNKSLPYDRLRRPPAPTLASHGSGGAGADPKLPIWTYATYHPGFGADWMRKAIQEGTQRRRNSTCQCSSTKRRGFPIATRASSTPTMSGAAARWRWRAAPFTQWPEKTAVCGKDPSSRWRANSHAEPDRCRSTVNVASFGNATIRIS